MSTVMEFDSDISEFPVAPEGFHYPGQCPKLLNIDGKITVSKLGQYLPCKFKITLAEKYKFTYIVNEKNNNVVSLKCLICFEDIKVFSKETKNFDFTNFKTHLQNKHLSALSPDDQVLYEKKKKDHGNKGIKFNL